MTKIEELAPLRVRSCSSDRKTFRTVLRDSLSIPHRPLRTERSLAQKSIESLPHDCRTNAGWSSSSKPWSTSGSTS